MTITRIAGAAALTIALVNPRHQAPAQTAGASLSGVVVSTDATPQPVRRAIVMLTGGGIALNLSTVADDAGRFRFLDLAPGRYTVRVSKPAYLTTAYGATRPGGTGTPVAVTEGQQISIRVALPRGAVIAGTIRDQFGQPMSGMQISVSPAESTTSASGVRLGSEAILTDDRGQYRAYGLMPGEYVVSAVSRLAGGGQLFRMTQAEFDAKVRALTQRYGADPTAPTATATAASDTTNLPPGSTVPLGYAPTFFPGTTIAADATRIRVTAGEERTGVDIAFVPVRAARVTGIVQGGNIPPQRIRPTLTVIGPSQPLSSGPTLSGPLADGSFTFTGVTPGRYTLMARTGPGVMMPTGDGRGSSSGNEGVPSLFATMDLSVDGNDIGGLVLALRPAGSIAGRIAFDASTLTPPGTLTAIPVALNAVGPSNTTEADSVLATMGLGLGRPPSTRVAADGTFILQGIVPGTYALSSSVPGGWWLRSAIANGRDLLDDLVMADGSFADIAGLVLTFSDRHSGVQGTLATATGQPASEFIVIAYPVDRALWKPGARRVKTTRPSSDGAFTLNDLPAGEYYLAALTDADPNEWQQASFLEQLVAASAKVIVAEGQKAKQDLRIAR